MREACALWDPAICSSVIPVAAMVASQYREMTSAGFPEDVAMWMLVGPDGREHVLIVKAHCLVQLVVRGVSMLSAPHLLTDLRIPASRERMRLDAIAAFNALAAGQSPLRGRLRDLPGARRWRLILQALDGYIAGRSQRDIAEALFGAARVRQDWGAPGEHMRDRIRRAVGRGRKLMAGDYVSLLR